MAVRERKLSDLLKRGYSDDELGHIYELGRFHLENGELKRAETIMNGIVAVAPDFVPAWLALTYIEIAGANYDQALRHAKQGYSIDPQNPLTALFLVTVLLCLGDVASAGAYLGEAGEQIENSGRTNDNIFRFYRAQLARFRNES